MVLEVIGGLSEVPHSAGVSVHDDTQTRFPMPQSDSAISGSLFFRLGPARHGVACPWIASWAISVPQEVRNGQQPSFTAQMYELHVLGNSQRSPKAHDSPAYHPLRPLRLPKSGPLQFFPSDPKGTSGFTSWNSMQGLSEYIIVRPQPKYVRAACQQRCLPRREDHFVPCKHPITGPSVETSSLSPRSPLS